MIDAYLQYPLEAMIKVNNALRETNGKKKEVEVVAYL